MARGPSGSLRGRAAVLDLTERRAEIVEEQIATVQKRRRVRELTEAVLGEIANRMPPIAYNQWFQSTPDDNAGFLAAGQKKLSELIFQETQQKNRHGL